MTAREKAREMITRMNYRLRLEHPAAMQFGQDTVYLSALVTVLAEELLKIDERVVALEQRIAGVV